MTIVRVIRNRGGIVNGGGALTALAELCGDLAEDATASYSAATGHGLSEAQLEWQSTFFHDVLHQKLIVFGKVAGVDDDWRMRVMDLTAEDWASQDMPQMNRNGHIYGSFCMDPATGDFYANPGTVDTRDLWQCPYSNGTWAQIESAFFPIVVNGPASGMVWHPNLYGSGDGGVTGCSTSDDGESLSHWRESTGNVQSEEITTSLGSSSGQGVYFAPLDEAIMGISTHIAVSPNGGSMPTWAVAGTPPIATRGTTSGSVPDFGAMILHPGNPNKIMILRRGGTRDFWTSSDGGASWTNEGTHPFTAGSGEASIVCALGDDMGCILNIRANGSTHTATAWRPPV